MIYSTETGSSTVNLCDWHSTLALSIKIRPSAVRPKKKQTRHALAAGIPSDLMETMLTCERDANVVVQQCYFSHCTGILQLQSRFLFYTEHDSVGSFDTNLSLERTVS